LPSDWAEKAYLEAAEQQWDALLDMADQPGNPLAESMWEMEKRKALRDNKTVSE
tara:strand:- start:234 stop:395 length:162 start_codon:yes stop_codon:yes gene_type:complete